MKLYIILLGFLLPLISVAQADSTLMANVDLIEAANRVTKCRDSLIFYRSVMDNQYKQIIEYEKVLGENESIIAYKDQQLDVMNGIVNRYDTELNRKTNFFNSKWFYFITGAATVTASVLVVDRL